MHATVAAAAGLVVGLVAGLLAKPTRQLYSTCCGTTLACVTCDDAQVSEPRDGEER